MKLSTPLPALFISNDSFRACAACGPIRGKDAFFAGALLLVVAKGSLYLKKLFLCSKWNRWGHTFRLL